MSVASPDLVAHTFAPLRVEEGAEEIRIAGTTFVFAISRANGLLRSVRILGQEWLARRPLPDLWGSEQVDPREGRWEAARETKAEVRVQQAGAERVVVTARGRYRGARGEAAPLRYELTYTIDCDGVVRVEVAHEATGEGALRWLVFSAASIRRSRVDFYSHIGDLAETEDTGGWVTQEVPPAGRQQLHAARVLPWLQLGNDTSGLDLVMDDAEHVAHGWTDSVPKADPLDPEDRAGHTFVLEAEGEAVRWTYFSLRNLYTPLRPGWRRTNRFFIAPAPAKAYDPSLADLRVHWLGPHQWCGDPFTYPTEEEIAALAQRGINLLVGGAHWRSGDYRHPDDAAEVRRVIAACHRYGLRIIPYITFTDLEYDTPVFPAHGEEWRIEPAVEFRHQTNLMCYGAEGWREHWRGEVEAILDRFDFDGLYIDFWVGSMACRNTRHGCGVKYPQFTLAGLREMAWHACRCVKARGADKFILCNTNLFAGALLNDLVDLRLPGEWRNVEETPEVLTRGHLNSRRLGCNALLLRHGEVSRRSVSFSLRCQSPMVMGHGRPGAVPPEPPSEPEGLLMQYADLLRFFGIGQAQTQSAFAPDGSLTWSGPSVTAYWSRSDRGTLLVLANLASRGSRGTLAIARPAAVGLQAQKRYLVYRPDRGELVGGGPLAGREIGTFPLALKPYEPALFLLAPSTGHPQVLWATLSDGVEGESFDGRAQRLSFTVKGAPGGRSRVTLYVGEAAVSAARQGDRPLRVRRRGPLATLEVSCREAVEVEFGRGDGAQGMGRRVEGITATATAGGRRRRQSLARRFCVQKEVVSGRRL